MSRGVRGLSSTCSAGQTGRGVGKGSRRLELLVEDGGTQQVCWGTQQQMSLASKVINGELCFYCGF